ncbi:Two Component Transcriptional Regulator, Fis family [Thiobacillus denitrificans ATCC 25259]|uniref:Two Component Transcriptional Regulator, Fis family n=1 Tax=Thiobacillus denitrificans (strain ATCC 25259 / T1) TaxID=292415 RepID=Q3SMR9_THIDA|nr:sigma-54 dependent transcriptional regulator [Thiobacillus denitrificans]AAZ95972.1 Two Component Transcriptional Regulator, Fis family [Thiobacillus denitrificans ATCC 25259]
MSGHILVVDDEVGIRELLSEILTDEGYDVHLAENAEAARAFRAQRRPDLVLLDIWMPDTDGVTLLKEWAGGGQLTMPVVMMSGHGTIDTAVEATRLGAADFLEKPVALAKLIDTVNKAIKRGVALPRRAPSMDLSALGRSTLIAELKKRLAQIAGNTAPVLLLGEAGSGFEICAQFLHQPASPWIEIKDRARLVSDPLSFVETLGNGTLYLPEVCELGRLEQKGLGLLLDRIEGSGARLVCASSRSLDAMVAAGEFDSRLFYRLSSLAIQVPPLREHREDIPDIANFMLAQLVEEGVCPVRRLTTPALNQLRNFDWPGNLPQLNNAVRTLAVTALASEIDAVDVNRVLAPMKHAAPAVAQGIPLDIPLREARDAFERMYFEHLIQKEGGSMTRVADKSGLERTHLYRKLKQLNIRHGRRLDEDL